MKRENLFISSLKVVKLRKMKRTGQEMDMNKVFGMVLVLACVALIIWGVYGKGFANISYLAKLLPGFNETIPEGTTIVGLNMEDGKLMYLGDKWREVDFKEESDSFVLGSYQFKPALVRDKLSSFYLDTSRRPEKFSLSVNHWRYWQVILADSNNFDPYNRLVIIFPNTKNGFAGPKSFPNNLDLGERNIDAISHMILGYGNFPIFEPVSFNSESLISLDLAKLDVTQSSSPIQQVVSWRDQILEGNSCEKFLDLNIGENEISKSYTVRKVDNYVFVDLSKAVTGNQKWDNDNCFGVENYNPEVVNSLENLQIIISFKDAAFPQTQYFYFDKLNGWQTPGSKIEINHLFSKDESVDRYDPSYFRMDFASGMYGIFKTPLKDISSFKVVIREDPSGKPLFEKNTFSREDIDKLDEIIYGILDKYNEALAPKEIASA